MAGHVAEAVTRGRAALEGDKGPPSAARLKTMALTATAAYHSYDLELMERLCREGIELAAELGDAPEVAVGHVGVLIGHAVGTMHRGGGPSDAIRLVEQAADVARRAGDDAAAGWALFNLAGMRWSVGDVEGAFAAGEEGIRRTQGHGWEGMVLPIVSTMRVANGEVAAGRAAAERCLEGARASGYPFALMRALLALSKIARVQGDVTLARACAEEQVLVGTAMGEKIQGVGSGRFNLALAHLMDGAFDRATDEMRQARMVVDSLGVSGTWPEPYLLLAELCERDGNDEEARELYERALEAAERANDAASAALARSGLRIDVAGDVPVPEWRQWLPRPR